MVAVSKIRSLEISRIAEEVVARAATLPIQPRQIAADCEIAISDVGTIVPGNIRIPDEGG